MLDFPAIALIALIAIATIALLGFKAWLIRHLWRKYRRRQLKHAAGVQEAEMMGQRRVKDQGGLGWWGNPHESARGAGQTDPWFENWGGSHV